MQKENYIEGKNRKIKRSKNRIKQSKLNKLNVSKGKIISKR
jgi:hypothetical protein